MNVYFNFRKIRSCTFIYFLMVWLWLRFQLAMCRNLSVVSSSHLRVISLSLSQPQYSLILGNSTKQELFRWTNFQGLCRKFMVASIPYIYLSQIGDFNKWLQFRGEALLCLILWEHKTWLYFHHEQIQWSTFFLWRRIMLNEFYE